MKYTIFNSQQTVEQLEVIQDVSEASKLNELEMNKNKETN